MALELQRLMDQGVALKRQGNLEGARDCYIQALQKAPTEIEIYSSLGKVAHLLRSQDLAVRSYLACAHLYMGPIEIAMQKNQFPQHLELIYNTIPAEILVKLPKKSAFMIFIDSNTPRHLAHSLIDLTPDMMRSNPQLSPYAEIYYSHIYGNGSYGSTMQKHRLTSGDQISMDEQVYIPYGQNFLLQNINWDLITTSDVIKLYF